MSYTTQGDTRVKTRTIRYTSLVNAKFKLFIGFQLDTHRSLGKETVLRDTLFCHVSSHRIQMSQLQVEILARLWIRISDDDDEDSV